MRRLLIAAVALVAVAASACSVSPGDKVTVTMREYSLKVAPTTVRSGRIRLAIDSVGNQPHDLALVLAKDLAEIPRTPDGKLDLTGKYRPFDEIKPFRPGHYIATSPNLNAGHYLVLCTIHANEGMVGHLTIVPRTKKET
jgi:plastocyanin